MGRACTVCTHPAADAINAGLQAGQTLRSLAAEYGLSDSALDRHARRHLFARAGSNAAATPESQEIRNNAPAGTGKANKRRSVPAWLWAFAVGFGACWLRQRAARDPE